MFGYVGYLASCTHDDQIIEPVEPEEVINSATDLVSTKVTTPPAIDGTVDAIWTSMPILEFSTAVPEVTGDVFRGYTGNIIPRSRRLKPSTPSPCGSILVAPTTENCR